MQILDQLLSYIIIDVNPVPKLLQIMRAAEGRREEKKSYVSHSMCVQRR